MKTTKRWIAAMMTAVLALTALAGCGPKEPAADPAAGGTEPEMTVFTVGFDQDFPPYGFVNDDGDYDGFDIEMATTLAGRLGWEIKLQPINWDAKDMELSTGAIDCIWNGFTINGREDGYTWSEPYMDNSQVFVVAADAGIATFEDLAGKTVATQADSSAEEALGEEENADLVASFKELRSFGEYNTAFMELESGAIDAVAMDIGVAKFQISGREDQFVLLEQTLSDEQYGVGFLLGNTELRDIVQAELDKMVADGTFAQISEKWFGYNVYCG